MPFLLKYWKYLLVLVLCLACFGVGRFGVKPSEKIVVQDHIVEKEVEKKVETTKTTDHINKVTTIKKNKDGSTVTTVVDHSQIVEHTASQQTDQKSLTEDKKTEIVKNDVSSLLPNYRLGVQVHNPASLNWSPNYSAEVGYRLLGNLWGTASYDIQTHQPGIGISIDF